jgi:hypothetical protein
MINQHRGRQDLLRDGVWDRDPEVLLYTHHYFDTVETHRFTNRSQSDKSTDYTDYTDGKCRARSHARLRAASLRDAAEGRPARNL